MGLSSTKWTAVGPAPVDSPNVSLGASAGRIEVAAADPKNVDVMYVGGSGGGVWKTGVWTAEPPTWIPFTDDQPSLNFGGYHPLVVHPANNKLILGVVSGTGAGVLKSTNGGIGWTLLANSLFEGATLGSIAVHPTDVKIMYVSVWAGGAFAVPGVYKTTDGGATWKNTTSFHTGFVTDVVIAKYNSKHLFAGLVRGSNNAGVMTSGVYRSTDEGANWQVMGSLPSSIFLLNAVRLESAVAEKTAYASLFTVNDNGDEIIGRYKTTDGGNSWKTLAATPGSTEFRSWHLLLAVDPKNAAHVFANDAYELYESKDSGKTWKLASTFSDDWVNMTFDAKNNGVVTADRSVYTYEPATKKWISRAGNLQVTQLYTVTLDPQKSDRAYGVAQDHPQLFKFTGSILWAGVPGGTGETGKVLVDAGNSNRLYASNPLAPKDLVHRSSNGGSNWKNIFVNNDFNAEDYGLAYSVQKSFAMDPKNSKRLLIGLAKVYECKDATVASPTWKDISGVLSPAANVSGQYITALAIAPSDGKTIYAATADGHVWKTTTASTPWKQNDTDLFASGVGKVIDMRIDPSNPKRVFAVTNGGPGQNIWSLNPATNKWTAITGDMPNNLRMASIEVDWKAKPIIYVGTTRRVYVSTDLGVHWTIYGLYLPNTVTSDLQINAGFKTLAAATSGRGVWEILLAPAKSIAAARSAEEKPARKGAAAKKGKTAQKRVPAAAQLRPAPPTGEYISPTDLILLPGRLPGEPLVNQPRQRGPKRKK